MTGSTEITSAVEFGHGKPFGWVAGTNVTIFWHPESGLPDLFQILFQNKNYTLTLDNFVPTDTASLNVHLPRSASEALPSGIIYICIASSQSLTTAVPQALPWKHFAWSLLLLCAFDCLSQR